MNAARATFGKALPPVGTPVPAKKSRRGIKIAAWLFAGVVAVSLLHRPSSEPARQSQATAPDAAPEGRRTTPVSAPRETVPNYPIYDGSDPYDVRVLRGAIVCTNLILLDEAIKLKQAGLTDQFPKACLLVGNSFIGRKVDSVGPGRDYFQMAYRGQLLWTIRWHTDKNFTHE